MVNGKQHNITGLKYFCKTTKKNPYRYNGSGHYWLRHLAKHGSDITTTWCELFTDKESLVEFAVFFSEEFNIVQSSKWANLKAENGLDGGGMIGSGKGIPKSVEHKNKCSKSLLGRTFDDTWKSMLSINHANVIGEKNPNAKTWKIISPTGIITVLNGTMTNFCKQHNLPASVMRKIGRTNKYPKSGKCIGWQVYLIVS